MYAVKQPSRNFLQLKHVVLPDGNIEMTTEGVAGWASDTRSILLSYQLAYPLHCHSDFDK